MNVTHVIGVDPGLVHTGLVRLVFEPDLTRVWVSHRLVNGLDVSESRRWAEAHPGWPITATAIEDYQPRSHFNSDQRMTAGVSNFRGGMPKAHVLLNHGVKKIVKQAFMERLGVWQFKTPSHHQDLRSAARIALLLMFKDEKYNQLLADFVLAHINGADWEVRAL